MNIGDRIVELSGLSGASAAENLTKIAGIFGVSAGEILLNLAQLSSGSALEIALSDISSQAVEETIKIVFGGSGWNFDVPAGRITGKNRLGEDVDVEDEEIIEFLTIFAMWRSSHR